jgi:hypothetical protein
VPPRPAGATGWVEGEWLMHGGRWTWLLGRWVKAETGTRYCPWVTVRSSDGVVYFAPGVWKNAHGSVTSPPPALVFATTSNQAVYDPEGQVDDTGKAIEAAPARHIDAPQH